MATSIRWTFSVSHLHALLVLCQVGRETAGAANSWSCQPLTAVELPRVMSSERVTRQLLRSASQQLDEFAGGGYHGDEMCTGYGTAMGMGWYGFIKVYA